MPSVSPSARSRLTSLTAWTVPRRARELDDQVLDLERPGRRVVAEVGGAANRPSDATLPHVEARAHLVADEVQGEDREEHEQRREQHHVRRPLELRAPVLDHDAPADAADVADAEEGQRGLDDDQGGARAMKAKETIAGTTLGRISRRMIRMLRAPSVRDAITKSRSPHTIVWARGDPGDGRDGDDRQGDASPRTSARSGDDAPGGARKATSASSRTRPGMASMMLSTAPIVPCRGPGGRSPRSEPDGAARAVRPMTVATVPTISERRAP